MCFHCKIWLPFTMVQNCIDFFSILPSPTDILGSLGLESPTSRGSASFGGGLSILQDLSPHSPCPPALAWPWRAKPPMDPRREAPSCAGAAASSRPRASNRMAPRRPVVKCNLEPWQIMISLGDLMRFRKVSFPMTYCSVWNICSGRMCGNCAFWSLLCREP